MQANYHPPADLLKDRTILVTGAGDGIGRAISLSYAAHGATVVLLGKTLSNLEAVYDEIESLGAPTPAIFPLNLESASEHDYEGLGITLLETFERLDGLVHCAAMLPYLSRIKDYDYADWIKVMQVNLNAPFAITQACLPLLLAAPDSSVIFTSDAVATQAKPFYGAYAASKAGQQQLMQMLAEEMSDSRVRFNSIVPGPTRTKLRKTIFPGEEMDQIKAPEALANLYLWLIGPDSQGTNGQQLNYQAA